MSLYLRMRTLENKNCIVTGAGGGIGRGIALAFAKEGASIAICDRDSESLETTRQLVKKTGAKVFSRVFDIRDISAIKYFVSEVEKAFIKLDILANVAGIMPVSHIDILTDSLVDDILKINLKAPIFFTKYAVPLMKRSGGGSIINMASVTGHNGFPDVTVYGATKGGLISLARGHAIELASYNIRVNTVSPGTVNSPMLHKFVHENSNNPEYILTEYDKIHPRGKISTIEEVANVFVFLASDASANITAEDVRCDGGYCVRGGQPK